jgi:selenide,water dikinase
MTDPRLLTPTDQVEDAAAYLLDADRALLFTADYFTPVVDDPYRYGQIAAANAFSDIYAMGGRPALALNLTNFPARAHRTDELATILQGGADKAIEAGCLVVGGHTIDDPEPKYGMAVVGFAHPDHLIRKGGARAGDLLVLTKPLGSGIAITAFKGDALSEEGFGPAMLLMETLNRDASQAAVEAGVAGGTDVTGFGLLGHLGEMCLAAEVSAEVHFSALPFLTGVEALASGGWIPGGTVVNREFVTPLIDLPSGFPDHRLLMATDAQTSGGLLLCVPPGRMPAFAAAMRNRGREHWVVGEIAPPPVRLKILL